MREATDRREDGTVGRDAFMARVQRVLDASYRLATLMLLEFAAAEDAVHDATLDAWTQYRRVGGEVPSFQPWFLAIVVARCRRRRWKRVLPHGERGDGPEASDLVSDVLLRFGTDDRVALYCRHSLHMKPDEIALVLGTSSKRVRSRIRKAERQLRAEVEMDLGITFAPAPEWDTDEDT